jgi:hypothetical protein
MPGKTNRREFGDYQTPIEFTDAVCRHLRDKLGLAPAYVLEPTCGIGNFLKSSTSVFDAEGYYGIEISPEYCRMAELSVNDKRATMINHDLFDYDFEHIKSMVGRSPLLIIGNPPWVNNSTLSSLESGNQPKKTNFRGLKGIDAITGESNFDISECMIYRLLSAFERETTTMALLCKTSTARNVFCELKRSGEQFGRMDIYLFDAKAVFGVSVDGCLMVVAGGRAGASPDYCSVYDFYGSSDAVSKFGYRGGKIYSDYESGLDFEGSSIFEWRQGVKHDCSAVMEIDNSEGGLTCKDGTPLRIEDDYVYPLLKSSGIKTPLITKFKKSVIITQRKPKQDTACIKKTAPNTWRYLSDNKDLFGQRKSSIYRNAPDYAIFGVGDYSFSPYKVVVSGIYKRPLFALAYSTKPIMIDDTCYSLSFEVFDDAYVTMLLLNNKLTMEFILSISFADSKRPYTKKVLSRIDLRKVCGAVTFDAMKETEESLQLSPYVTEKMYSDYLHRHIDGRPDAAPCGSDMCVPAPASQ